MKYLRKLAAVVFCLTILSCCVVLGSGLLQPEIKNRSRIEKTEDMGRLLAPAREERRLHWRRSLEPGASVIVKLSAEIQAILARKDIADREEKAVATFGDVLAAIAALAESDPIESTAAATSPELAEVPAVVEPDDDWPSARAKLNLKIRLWTDREGVPAALLADSKVVVAGDIVETVCEEKTYRWKIVAASKDEGIRIEKLDVR